eukprot:CAMPEP_0170103400 /NCGR_PEP_ID=MMETSP0020_2-20130122/3472_1 /TAXON_ID=98059 /ORGANISM="Dinobryon sp., Strain UTEXLB2267" /LENGTH=146 /DNA_ID=CAMNT_0010326961 /DNA_START=394 /DNA_END=832 /DNA_ORIENTATION=-
MGSARRDFLCESSGGDAEVVGTWAQGQGREVQREVVVSDGTDADAGGVSAAGADGWGCAGVQATANCELCSSFFAITGGCAHGGVRGRGGLVVVVHHAAIRTQNQHVGPVLRAHDVLHLPHGPAASEAIVVAALLVALLVWHGDAW